MHPHEELIHTFYTAFKNKDAATMGKCYHAEAFFSDPAFTELHNNEPAIMWKMLLERATDLEIVYGNVFADAVYGYADWKATYTFSKTGRKVVNVIHAEFRFMNGKIVKHTDSFDFWKWSRQALGVTGWLLGFTPFLQKKVSAQAMGSLKKYMKGK